MANANYFDTGAFSKPWVQIVSENCQLPYYTIWGQRLKGSGLFRDYDLSGILLTDDRNTLMSRTPQMSGAPVHCKIGLSSIIIKQ